MLKGSHGKTGEKSPHWKGDEVGSGGVHSWVRRKKYKSVLCEHCGLERKLELANISGEYKRDVDDFYWLCRTCHKAYDKQKKFDKLRKAYGL